MVTRTMRIAGRASDMLLRGSSVFEFVYKGRGQESASVGKVVVG